MLLTCEDGVCLGPQPRGNRSTFLVKNRSRCYPGLAVDGRGARVLPNAGAVLLLRTAEAVGLDAALCEAARPWRAAFGPHDPGQGVVGPAGGGRVGPATPRARCCWIWRCRWRSAVTAWPTSPSCAPPRRCSGRWPPIPRCPG